MEKTGTISVKLKKELLLFQNVKTILTFSLIFLLLMYLPAQVFADGGITLGAIAAEALKDVAIAAGIAILSEGASSIAEQDDEMVQIGVSVVGGHGAADESAGDEADFLEDDLDVSEIVNVPPTDWHTIAWADMHWTEVSELGCGAIENRAAYGDDARKFYAKVWKDRLDKGEKAYAVAVGSYGCDGIVKIKFGPGPGNEGVVEIPRSPKLGIDSVGMLSLPSSWFDVNVSEKDYIITPRLQKIDLFHNYATLAGNDHKIFPIKNSLTALTNEMELNMSKNMAEQFNLPLAVDPNETADFTITGATAVFSHVVIPKTISDNLDAVLYSYLSNPDIVKIEAPPHAQKDYVPKLKHYELLSPGEPLSQNSLPNNLSDAVKDEMANLYQRYSITPYGDFDQSFNKTFKMFFVVEGLLEDAVNTAANDPTSATSDFLSSVSGLNEFDLEINLAVSDSDEVIAVGEKEGQPDWVYSVFDFWRNDNITDIELLNFIGYTLPVVDYGFYPDEMGRHNFIGLQPFDVIQSPFIDQNIRFALLEWEEIPPYETLIEIINPIFEEKYFSEMYVLPESIEILEEGEMTELEKLKLEAEKAKLEAEIAKAEAEKAKAEAEKAKAESQTTTPTPPTTTPTPPTTTPTPPTTTPTPPPPDLDSQPAPAVTVGNPTFTVTSQEDLEGHTLVDVTFELSKSYGYFPNIEVTVIDIYDFLYTKVLTTPSTGLNQMQFAFLIDEFDSGDYYVSFKSLNAKTEMMGAVNTAFEYPPQEPVMEPNSYVEVSDSWVTVESNEGWTDISTNWMVFRAPEGSPISAGLALANAKLTVVMQTPDGPVTQIAYTDSTGLATAIFPAFADFSYKITVDKVERVFDDGTPDAFTFRSNALSILTMDLS